MCTYIHHNPFNIKLSVLDKIHRGLPVEPNVYKAAGFLLSSLAYFVPNQRLYVDYINQPDFSITTCLEPVYINRKVLILGLSDSTCLGMCVSSALQNADYYTVTKDKIKLSPCIKFDDNNALYVKDSVDFSNYDEVVIVANTLTDGQAAFNVMNSLYHDYHVRNYRIFTLMNLLCEKDAKKFCDLEKEMNNTIIVHSLVSGCVPSNNAKDDATEEPVRTFANAKQWNLPKFSRYFLMNDKKMTGYFKDGGHFGVNTSDFDFLENISTAIAEKINQKIGFDKKVLIVGHDEMTYIANRIAANMKGNVKVAMTRTEKFPVVDLVKNRVCFYENDRTFYFYNAKEIENEYDYVLLFSETGLNVMLTRNTSIMSV